MDYFRFGFFHGLFPPKERILQALPFLKCAQIYKASPSILNALVAEHWRLVIRFREALGLYPLDFMEVLRDGIHSLPFEAYVLIRDHIRSSDPDIPLPSPQEEPQIHPILLEKPEPAEVSLPPARPPTPNLPLEAKPPPPKKEPPQSAYSSSVTKPKLASSDLFCDSADDLLFGPSPPKAPPVKKDPAALTKPTLASDLFGDSADDILFGPSASNTSASSLSSSPPF